MTLDEYRMHVFEKLKACTEAACARELLSEVQALLASSRMSGSGQKGFWQSLNHDLNVLAHQLGRSSVRAVVSARSVIATAQSAIAQYQRQLKSDGIDRMRIRHTNVTVMKTLVRPIACTRWDRYEDSIK